MIKLENIRIDGNSVKCDIIPEDSETSGSLEVDANTNEIISYVLPKGYEYCTMHVAHARFYIDDNVDKIKNKEITSKIIMWY